MFFEKIKKDTFESLPLGAGILCDKFTPTPLSGATNVADENILGATSGGSNFSAVPSFIDHAEGIDNCPPDMKELKDIDTVAVKLSGTFTSLSAKLAAQLAAAADVSGQKVTPRLHLKPEDFKDLWLVCDYGKGGMIAIHIMNALSTGGFSIQTENKNKGKSSFEFTGHFSMDKQDVVPYEVYIAKGTEMGGAKV